MKIEKFSFHDKPEYEVIKCDEQEDIIPLLYDLKPNNFVFVQFANKKKVVHYVGQIELQLEDKTKFSIWFLRKKRMVLNFFFPDVSDASVVNFENIVRKLPEPEFTGGTSRAATAMSFNINFEKYKFC